MPPFCANRALTVFFPTGGSFVVGLGGSASYPIDYYTAKNMMVKCIPCTHKQIQHENPTSDMADQRPALESRPYVQSISA